MGSEIGSVWAVDPRGGLSVREVELWRRLGDALGPAYAHVWAAQMVHADLGGRTVVEALAEGVPCKRIWRSVWTMLELPASER